MSNFNFGEWLSEARDRLGALVEVQPPPDGYRRSAPWSLSLRDWRAIGICALRDAMDRDYGMAASSIAFSAFLSLLPLLAAVAFAYSMIVSPQTVVANIQVLVKFLPGDARTFVGNWLVRNFAQRNGHGAALLASLLVTLYSAGRVGRSIISGVQIACGVNSSRGFFAKRIVSLAIVFVGALLFLSALLAISGLALLETVVTQTLPIASGALRIGFWSAAALGAGGALAAIYRYVPTNEPVAWRWVAPGALVATLAWLGATVGFGAYLGSFGSYDRRYGSIGSIVVLQLWLNLSAHILLVGARLNVEAVRRAGLSTFKQHE